MMRGMGNLRYGTSYYPSAIKATRYLLAKWRESDVLPHLGKDVIGLIARAVYASRYSPDWAAADKALEATIKAVKEAKALELEAKEAVIIDREYFSRS